MISRSRVECSVFAVVPVIVGLSLLVVAPGLAHAHLSIIRQGDESTGDRAAGDRFGSSLAVGDFNGDGIQDLATGARTENVSGVAGAGSVTVSFGSFFGLTHVGAIELDVTDFGFPPQASAGFGTALAVARLDNDGYDDLIVGAPLETVGGVQNAGRVYFYRGGPNGPTPWFDFTQEDVGGFSLPREYFGFSLLAKNFDTDPGVELVIGAPSQSGDGMIFYIKGTIDGPFGPTTFFDPDVLGYEAQAGDLFGYCLTSGNLLSDSRLDLVVGAPGRRIGIQDGAGAVYLIRGTSTGLSTTGDYVLDAGMADTAEEGAAFGFSVVAGKFLGPGTYDYLVIGEPIRMVGGGSEAGRIHGIRGSSSGPVLSSAAVYYQSNFGGTDQAGDRFGTTLASGYFGEDPHAEDLVIGTPLKGVFGSNTDDAGECMLVYGAPSGLGSVGYTYFAEQEQVGEVSEEGDHLGSAAAIGAFDDGGWGTLAVSAEGENNNTGLVHIFAPWRQPAGYQCRGSLVVDCEDEIVFSQKPFEEFPMANSSILMVALMGCERALLPEGNSQHIPLSTTLVVPTSVIEGSPGENFLKEGETVTFENLLYASILTPGGDVALALAHVLYPGTNPVGNLKESMNQRAAQLGMTHTQYLAPAVFDYWEDSYDAQDHHTSAYDLYLLSRAAKENSLLSQILTTRVYHMSRQIPGQGPTLTFLNNWFLVEMKESIAKSSGAKRAFTTHAGMAMAYTADGRAGTPAIVASLGTPEDGGFGQTAVDMMELGLGQCFEIHAAPWDGTLEHIQEGIVAEIGRTHGLSGLFETNSGDSQFELFFSPGGETPLILADITLRHTSHLDLSNGESTTLGLSPLGTDQGVRVTNTGEVGVFVYLNGSGYEMGAGSTVTLPPRSDLEYWVVENGAPNVAHLMVEEAYVHALDYSAGGGDPSSPLFSARMSRRGHVEQDLFEYAIEWHSSGGEFLMAIHDADIVVGLPDLDPASFPAGVFRATTRAFPNPFRDWATVELQLSQPAEVALSIHDAGGRAVRTFPSRRVGAGQTAITWDGLTNEGRSAPPGVYFYRFHADGTHEFSGRLVRLDWPYCPRPGTRTDRSGGRGRTVYSTRTSFLRADRAPDSMSVCSSRK